MKKLTDQELDSVFKHAAEGFQPAFDAAAWEAMNAKLDQPKAPALWKRWMPFALIGLGIFSAGIWVGIHFNEDPSSTPTSRKSEVNVAIQPTDIIHTEDQAFNSTSQEQSAKENENAANPARKEILREKRGQVVSNSKGVDVALKQNRNDGNGNSFITDQVTNLNEQPIINSVSEGKEDLIEKGKEDFKKDELTENPKDSVLSNQLATEVKVDSIQADAEAKHNKKESVNHRAVFLRALVSPDFSSIRHTSSSSLATGSNYALMMEYQVTHRWSISAGGIWSMKKYSTDQEITYGKYTADSMVGACRILDIPVNVNYRFRPQAKTSFYAGVGLSSYIMLQEDYTYTFNTSSGVKDFTYNIEKKNNEWFKMLNVSVGVQYQLAPRFHLQAEPFLKTPLVGIGEWDVLLSSVGIFMGLKYKIN